MKDLFGTLRTDLHIRTYGKGTTPKWTESWVEVLRCWAALHRRYHEQTRTDLGWWYSERPNLSVLTGAVWTSGGSALEEYKNQKWHGDAQYAGRADLWVVLKGKGHSIEAKHLEASLTGGVREEPIAAALAEARDDARKVDEDPDHRVGLVFVTPYLPIPKDADLDEALDVARANVREHRAAEYPKVRAASPARGLRADFFPRWASTSGTLRDSDKEPGKRYCYPGISLLIGFERD
jgi:hypothetical protein